LFLQTEGHIIIILCANRLWHVTDAVHRAYVIWNPERSFKCKSFRSSIPSVGKPHLMRDRDDRVRGELQQLM